MSKFNRIIALENTNLYVLNNRIAEFIEKNQLGSAENKCRLVKMTLRRDVRHFPINVPFIAAIRRCSDGQNVVLGIQCSKIAVIGDDAIASETKVGSEFSIGNVDYKLEDTINGMPRYRPHKKNKK